jgi:hypothetical protein
MPSPNTNDSFPRISAICTPDDEKSPLDVTISWKLLLLKCWQDYVDYDLLDTGKLETYNRSQWVPLHNNPLPEKCSAGNHIVHDEAPAKVKREAATTAGKELLEIKSDGLYVFYYEMVSEGDFTATVVIEIRRDSGYLSAVDWPLLPVCPIISTAVKHQSFLISNRLLFIIPVLRLYVLSVCVSGNYLACSLVSTMA